MNPGDAVVDISEVKVLQVARRESGMTLAEIAVAMSRDEATVGGWFAESADRFPPLPLIPKLCHVLGDPLIIEWLYARYRQLCEGDPAFDGAADAERVRSLLVRGLNQATNALTLTQDIGPTFTRSEAKQISEAILLAVATLAAAAREARGRRPAPARRLAFSRGDGDEAAGASGRPTWRERLRAWWRGAGTPWEVVAIPPADLTQARRLIGAMGQIIRKAPVLRPEDRAVSCRLLEEGRAFAARVGQG